MTLTAEEKDELKAYLGKAASRQLTSDECILPNEAAYLLSIMDRETELRAENESLKSSQQQQQ